MGIYIYICVCVWVSVCVHGWVAKEGILSSASLSNIRLSRGSSFFVDFGANTTQRDAPAWSEVRTKDVGQVRRETLAVESHTFKPRTRCWSIDSKTRGRKNQKRPAASGVYDCGGRHRRVGRLYAVRNRKSSGEDDDPRWVSIFGSYWEWEPNAYICIEWK